MPLRYLTLKEPQYVPQYNTLDPNLVNSVAGAFQQQGAQNRKHASNTLGILEENVMSTAPNLPEEFQQEMMNIMEQSRGAIEQSFKERGARHSLSEVDRQARNAQRSLQPYQSVAQQAQSYQEKINEAEGVDPTVKQWAKQQAQFGRDEQGNPVFQGAQLEAFDNWQDLQERTSDFLSKAKASVMSGDLESLPQFENTMVQRNVLEILSGDQLQTAGVAQLLNDDQSRTQLVLGLQARGVDPTSDVSIIAEPKVTDKNGNVIQEEKRKTVDAIIAEAINIVKPTANIMSYQKNMIKDTRTNQAAMARINDTIPAVTSEMHLGFSGHGFDSQDKISEAAKTAKGTIDILQQELSDAQQGGNQYEIKKAEDKLKAAEQDFESYITLQDRSLQEAGLDHGVIQQELSKFLDDELKGLDHTIDPTKQASKMTSSAAGGFGYALSFRSGVSESYRDQIEQYYDTGVLSQGLINILERETNLDFSNYNEIIKESASNFRTPVRTQGVSSADLRDQLINTVEFRFGNGLQGATEDFKWASSDPEKRQSIFETGDYEDIEAFDNPQIGSVDGQMRLFMTAKDANDKVLGVIETSLPDNALGYLDPTSKHQWESYNGSQLDAIMMSPGKQGVIEVANTGVQPDEQGRLPKIAVNVKSKLAVNEDGTVDTRDTMGSNFLVSFNTTGSGRHQIPVDRKSDVMYILQAINNNDLDSIVKRYGRL